MNVTQTGLDSAPMIPLGAVVKDAYWTVAANYMVGERFETKDLALVYAIDETRDAVARHLAHYLSLPGTLFVPLPERIMVEFRWYLEYPGGGGIDLPVQRNDYPTLADAEEALALYRRFSPEVKR